MKRTFLTLFVILLCTSCTVEKRLHNRGWNVQWNKSYGIQKEGNEKEERRAQNVTHSAEFDEPVYEEEPKETSIESIKSDVFVEHDQSVEEDDFPFMVSTPSDTTKERKTPIPDELQEKKEQRVERNRSLKPHHVFFILALISAVIASYAFISLSSAVYAGEIVILFLGGFFFGLLALLFLIFALIFIAMKPR